MSFKKAKAVPNSRTVAFQRLDRKEKVRIWPNAPSPERGVGNFHLMLQVQCCAAALELWIYSANLLVRAPNLARLRSDPPVMRIMMKSKIHRATVTQADLH